MDEGLGVQGFESPQLLSGRGFLEARMVTRGRECHALFAPLQKNCE